MPANLQFSKFFLPLRLVCLLHFTNSSWSSCVLYRSRENLYVLDWIDVRCMMSNEYYWVLSNIKAHRWEMWILCIRLSLLNIDPFTNPHNTYIQHEHLVEYGLEKCPSTQPIPAPLLRTEFPELKIRLQLISFHLTHRVNRLMFVSESFDVRFIVSFCVSFSASGY